MEKMLKKIKTGIKNPKRLLLYFIFKFKFHWLPDKLYLKLVYWGHFGKRLNFKKPVTFNEKLQWLKIYNRKDVYTQMVDKYKVKEYIAEKIGEEYIIPTIGVWESFDEIDFEKLPAQFVLKCTHDSGGVVIVKDKNEFDKEAAKNKLEKSLKTNYYYSSREWPYKNVKPRIIAETYMIDGQKDDLPDYKLMCFNGEVKCSFTCTERYSESGLKVTFFDKNWEVMPFERHYPRSKQPLEKPVHYGKMVQLAEILAEGIPFVRVDFYVINGKIYFGEITFYPGSGVEEFYPEEWDRILGSWIDLPMVQSIR